MMISIVIPVFNEENNIQELFTRTVAALEAFTGDFEIICVDDGSKDNTFCLLLACNKADKRFKFISLSRNFGHQRAILAGLSHAKGDLIGIMDGDLQDPPELFEKFNDKIQQGYDVVYAVRTKRKENWFLKTAYWIFYRILSRVGETAIPIDSGDFSLFRREILDHILRMPEQSLYLRGLRSWVGFRQTAVEYERPERASGKPKFSFRELVRLASNGLFSFSNFPIKFLGRLGLVIIMISIIYGAIVLYKRIFYPAFIPEGFTTLILAILFFSGIQLISLRVLGEYIVRTYEESKKRPLFIVKEKHLE
jgi:dolichol-phosphate mannosyltransferase